VLHEFLVIVAPFDSPARKISNLHKRKIVMLQKQKSFLIGKNCNATFGRQLETLAAYSEENG